MILKLRAYGIQGHVLKWIENWLKDRSQCTILNGEMSTWADVLSGVPQGSVLGPLLFIIYIDDIDECKGQIDILRKFADDTKVGNTIRSISDNHELQTCIDNMLNWADKWKMDFNIPKTPYYMNNQPLAVVESEKDIGIYVTHNLKPSEHCRLAARTAMTVLFQVLRAFSYRDKKIFLQLYITYVCPHVEFAVPAWSPWLAKDVKAIERVQEKFIRNVQGLRGTTYQDKLNELGILSLENRRNYLDLVECFKVIHGISNVTREGYFELVSDRSRRSTRYSECPLNIVINRCNLDIRKFFFNNRIAPYWNRLPNDLKLTDRLSLFKSRLKVLMLNNHLENQVAELRALIRQQRFCMENKRSTEMLPQWSPGVDISTSIKYQVRRRR